MYLSQLTTPSMLPVSVAELSGHLRLGSGFADDGAEDALLAAFIGSAAASLERALSLAFGVRTYELRCSRWDRSGGVALPVGPVGAVSAVSIVTPAGETVLDPARWRLEPGRPARLVPGSVALPALSEGEAAKIVFTAGHAAAADMPADLRHAVTLLAAEFYEHRSGGFSEGGFPPAVEALIARYRPVRLG